MQNFMSFRSSFICRNLRLKSLIVCPCSRPHFCLSVISVCSCKIPFHRLKSVGCDWPRCALGTDLRPLITSSFQGLPPFFPCPQSVLTYHRFRGSNGKRN